MRGYYGTCRRTKLEIAIGGFLGALVLTGLERASDAGRNSAQSWLSFLILSTVVWALVWVLYWGLDRLTRRHAAAIERHCAAFLIEVLEARPFDTADARPQPSHRRQSGRGGG